MLQQEHGITIYLIVVVPFLDTILGFLYLLTFTFYKTQLLMELTHLQYPHI
jgi:hypothetical protein